MDVQPYTKRFFKCPACNGREFACEHLWEPRTFSTGETSRTAGPWYCDDCGVGWEMTAHLDGRLEVTDSGKKHVKQIAVMEIPPQTESIWFTVEDTAPLDSEGKPDNGGKLYYYQSHTCPTNYFRSMINVRVGDDEDPHGLAQLRAIAPAVKGEDQRTLLQLLVEGVNAKQLALEEELRDKKRQEDMKNDLSVMNIPLPALAGLGVPLNYIKLSFSMGPDTPKDEPGDETTE